MSSQSKKIYYQNAYAVYNCADKCFLYNKTICDMFKINFDGYMISDAMLENGKISKNTANDIKQTIINSSQFQNYDIIFKEYKIKDLENIEQIFNTVFINDGKNITITFTMTNNYNGDFDELTGLYQRSAFTEKIKSVLQNLNTEKIKEYIIVYLDVQRFKVINDMFGMKEGDNLLIHISETISSALEGGGKACRMGSDRFLFFTKCKGKSTDTFIESILECIASYDLPFEIICNAGIYNITDANISADDMINRAIIAQTSIKGSYTQQYNYYKEELRKTLLTEQEISGIMKTAMNDEQFVVYYQPQYNHSTGMLVGAEALVRWIHPERGLISPGNFIPIFEKNGFITRLDMYVFEKTCQFIKKCIDKKFHIVPISINLTRYDIFSPNFIENLENIRRKYDIPPKYIRVEITESAAVGNSQFINEAVKKLHDYSYVVEMDDFGSGYSSLNILKDIDFDIIKLDMKFLHGEKNNSGKGGTIISSVVRMVNWLGLPVIAEGVETVKQADFLGSIGCDYIQGYLYSKPLPEEQYEKLISGMFIGATIPQMNLIETMNAENFWSSESLETLIFNNFVGGAAIFDYNGEKIEILRVNKKYLKEICMNMSEKDLIHSDPLSVFDSSEKEKYISMLEKAIQTSEEQECETWRTLTSECCGEEKICLRSNVRMIGNSKGNYLFYATVRNITNEKNQFISIIDNERRFKAVSEQLKVYFWEYTIATHEMRPCFRCMRDLGFPPVLTNYPESAIERGVFPPETADMYRDWHIQLANGVKSLEAIIPLTPDRIPFRVRYTTEFDEMDRPIKAYGSAELVV